MASRKTGNRAVFHSLWSSVSPAELNMIQNHSRLLRPGLSTLLTHPVASHIETLHRVAMGKVLWAAPNGIDWPHGDHKSDIYPADCRKCAGSLQQTRPPFLANYRRRREAQGGTRGAYHHPRTAADEPCPLAPVPRLSLVDSPVKPPRQVEGYQLSEARSSMLGARPARRGTGTLAVDTWASSSPWHYSCAYHEKAFLAAAVHMFG